MRRWLVLLSTAWWLMVPALDAAAVVNGGAATCKNAYGDQGVCMSEVRCVATGGIGIGFCENSITDRESCCMYLPCSVPQVSNDELESIIKHGLRQTRDLQGRREPAPAQLASSESCGLSDAEMSQLLSTSAREEHLLNGQKVREHKYPWMLALWVRTNSVQFPTCGAGLISVRHAITAAHCITRPTKEYLLRGGSVINKITKITDKNSNTIVSMLHRGDELSQKFGSLIEIDQIVVNPDFQPFTFENDVAFIRFVKPITLGKDLYPICLPPPLAPGAKPTDYSLDVATVTGWGCESEKCQVSDVPTTLMEVQMPIISNELAMCWYMNDSDTAGRAEYIPSRTFVVGGDETGKTTTCRGDSGSPVVRSRPVPVKLKAQGGVGNRWEVIGLVSWSKGCGHRFRPSVWTRVENYVPWIMSLMKN